MTSDTESYIGLNYHFDDNKFRWVDNTIFNYSNWQNGQPNITLDQYCVVQYRSYWYSRNCNYTSAFICKKDANRNTYQDLAAIQPLKNKFKSSSKNSFCPTRCPDGWAYFNEAKSCYKVWF